MSPLKATIRRFWCMGRKHKRLWGPLLFKGSDIYLPSQKAGNFDTSGTQSSRTKITMSLGLWACSVLMLFTLKDAVKSFVNEMPLHNKSHTNLSGSLSVYTWADFSLHLFIFLLPLSTRIMSETAWWTQCVGTARSHIRITAGLPAVQQRPVSAQARASSHCDGQLEILFILIQLSFSISPLDWSLKAKAAQVVPA